MQLSHSPARLSASFDEPNLLVSAGLVPAVRLAEKVGLPDLAGQHVTAGSNAGAKVMCLVAGMAAGADSIDDLGVLRHAGAARVFRGVRAPSTLGTFLRSFTFGHVRQLDAVAARVLAGLAQSTPLLAGIEQGCRIDIDDTVKPVFGPGKQGAQFGYTKVRGLNAQLATISTAQAAPVIAATRLRRGAAASSHGAVRMIRDAIVTARRCGATGEILVRADSAYCSSAILQAVSKAGARFSVGMPLNARVRAAIDSIADDAWVRIEYPWAIPDPDTGELISAAEIAEIEYTAFTRRSKARNVTARLIVRRIRRTQRVQEPGSVVSRLALPRTVHRQPGPAGRGRVDPPRARDHRAGDRRPEELRAGPPAIGTVHGQRRLAGRRDDRVQPHPNPRRTRRRATHPRDHRHHPGQDHQPARPAGPLGAQTHAATTPRLDLGTTLAAALDRGHDHLTPKPTRPHEPRTQEKPDRPADLPRPHTGTGRRNPTHPTAT